MATDYRHAGCTTPLLRDLPDGEPKAGAVVIAKDWMLLPEMVAPAPASPLPLCPDCGGSVSPSPAIGNRGLERVPA
jgi:hypothetical protein